MVVVHKKLREATSFNPTKKSYSMEIANMCKKIKDDKITLPLYQRDISWTFKKSVDLFNYQLFGKAPVSPISINQINNENLVPQISFIDREIVDNSGIQADHQSVVDGQQRLTTNFKAFINHEDFRNIVLDVSRAKFRIIEGAPNDSQIPVGVLLNEDNKLLEDYLIKKDLISSLYPVLIQVRSKIHSYNYTINIAENLTEDEQIEWFEILNNAGSRVTTLQMAFSKLKIHNLDIYINYTKPFRDKVRDYGLDELFNPFTTNVSYPIAALNPAYEVLVKQKIHNNNYAPIPSDTKEDLLIKLEANKLKDIISLTLNSLETTLNFLSEYDLLDKLDRIDFVLYLVGYFAYNSGNPEKSISDLDSLVNWVNNTDFTNQSNSIRRKIFTDLLAL
ncbi:Protein of unknown function DUF262 [Paenibacillaceae bacterium GAS479]|nr:Protein of unknown function DUF262 [Paenibacillaceae bacterium GAS479]